MNRHIQTTFVIIFLSFNLCESTSAGDATILTFDYSTNPKVEPEYWVVMPNITKSMLRIEVNLEAYRTNSQVAFKEVTARAAATNIAGLTLIPITAKVEREAFAIPTDAQGKVVSIEPLPGVAGLRGVKSYVEVAGSKSNALFVASNLVVWSGCFYTDGQSNMVLRTGTRFTLDNKEGVADTPGSSKGWKFWK